MSCRSDWTDNICRCCRSAAPTSRNYVDLVSRNEFAGIDLEYRDINPALRDEFTGFVAELADSLHAAGKTLGVRCPSRYR